MLGFTNKDWDDQTHSISLEVTEHSPVCKSNYNSSDDRSSFGRSVCAPFVGSYRAWLHVQTNCCPNISPVYVSFEASFVGAFSSSKCKAVGKMKVLYILLHVVLVTTATFSRKSSQIHAKIVLGLPHEDGNYETHVVTLKIP